MLGSTLQEAWDGVRGQIGEGGATPTPGQEEEEEVEVEEEEEGEE